MVLADHVAVTPAGKLVGVPIPVAPVVAMVMLVNAVLTHKVGVDDGVPAVFAGVTVMVPVALTAPQPPLNGIV